MSKHVAVEIDADAWCAERVDLLSFDHLVHQAEDAHGEEASIVLRVRGARAALERATAQIALRYQRLVPRYNGESACPEFHCLRQRHRALHDLRKPLVRADYEHAIDVWQWILRLQTDASRALQTAALFHDIERLQSEANQRIEHTASDYLAFKEEHARRGATIVRDAMAGLSFDERCIERAALLVARHEQPGDDGELALLNDADALSFFSLNSPGFFRYFDGEHCVRKIRYTLSRMSARARAWLPRLRLEHAVSAALESVQRT